MRVGVTGATGFVGKRILPLLEARGHEVYALVRRVVANGNERQRLFTLEAPSPEAVSGLDAIIHLAAYLPASYADPGEGRRCLLQNAAGTFELLQICSDLKLRKLILASTNIYGLSDAPCSEDAPIHPSPKASHYLISKMAADFYGQHFNETQRLPVSVLRLASVYGPGLQRGIVASFASKFEAGELVAVDGGDNYRADFVYVDDVADAFANALERNVSGVFNIGSGTDTSPLQVAQVLRELYGAPTHTLQIQEPKTSARSGFSPLAVDRARAQLGFVPRELGRGLRDYVASRRAA